MSKEQRNIIEYLICVIGAFAMRFSLTNAKAYHYLRQFKGLEFLTRHYAIEHTLSIDDAVEDVIIVCNHHGGTNSATHLHSPNIPILLWNRKSSNSTQGNRRMTMHQEHQDRQFQIEHITQELVEQMMEEHGMTMQEAMDIIYGSHTYEKLENPRTGLFYQSPVYLMDILKDEVTTLS